MFPSRCPCFPIRKPHCLCGSLIHVSSSPVSPVFTPVFHLGLSLPIHIVSLTPGSHPVLPVLLASSVLFLPRSACLPWKPTTTTKYCKGSQKLSLHGDLLPTAQAWPRVKYSKCKREQQSIHHLPPASLTLCLVHYTDRPADPTMLCCCMLQIFTHRLTKASCLPPVLTPNIRRPFSLTKEENAVPNSTWQRRFLPCVMINRPTLTPVYITGFLCAVL